jgi:hypothetical protein
MLYAALGESSIRNSTYTGRSDNDIALVPATGRTVCVGHASITELGRLLQELAGVVFTARCAALLRGIVIACKQAGADAWRLLLCWPAERGCARAVCALGTGRPGV